MERRNLEGGRRQWRRDRDLLVIRQALKNLRGQPRGVVHDPQRQRLRNGDARAEIGEDGADGVSGRERLEENVGGLEVAMSPGRG